MNILVIDDNQAVRMSLKIILSPHFDKVAAVGDPHLIPALISEGSFDAVLLDMNFDNNRLDGSDGLFWLTRIKSVLNAPAVIMITAYGELNLAVEAMKMGASDFITKPWDNVELIEKVNKAVAENKKLLKQNKAIEEARETNERQKEIMSMTLDEFTLAHINDVVKQCEGNLSRAASILGINRQTLYNRLRKK